VYTLFSCKSDMPYIAKSAFWVTFQKYMAHMICKKFFGYNWSIFFVGFVRLTTIWCVYNSTTILLMALKKPKLARNYRSWHTGWIWRLWSKDSNRTIVYRAKYISQKDLSTPKILLMLCTNIAYFSILELYVIKNLYNFSFSQGTNSCQNPWFWKNCTIFF
jgi:hypothetical protein